jgi:hypothetical protein
MEALDGRLPVAVQAGVVAPGLELLVVEVLDGLVVQQGVDGAALRHRVELVHGLAELRAPFGHRDGEDDVEQQRDPGDPDEERIELDTQNGQHQRQLDDGRHDAVERHRDQRMHAARAAFDVARHAAGLPLEVEAQRQRMQVAEHLQRDAARRALSRLGEDQLAQLAEQRGRKAQQPVGHQERDRHHQQRLRHVGLGRHGVDQVLEQHRHADVRDLGAHHEGKRRHHAPLVAPQVGEQAPQRGPVGAIAARGLARGDGVGRGKGFAAAAHRRQSWLFVVLRLCPCPNLQAPMWLPPSRACPPTWSWCSR